MPLLESRHKCNRKLHSFVCELRWPTCSRAILVSYTRRCYRSQISCFMHISITELHRFFFVRIVRKCWSVFCFVPFFYLLSFVCKRVVYVFFSFSVKMYMRTKRITIWFLWDWLQSQWNCTADFVKCITECDLCLSPAFVSHAEQI